jgi:hypothetical protein
MCGRVTLQTGVDMSEGTKFGYGKVSAPCKYAIPDRGDMAIGQKKHILTFPFHLERKVMVHVMKIEGDHKFSTAK